MHQTDAHELAHVEDAADHVRGVCFKTGPPGCVGTELEWFVVPDGPDGPVPHVPLARTRAAAEAAGPLPHGSRLTFEPGGQVEISTCCAPDLATAARWARESTASLAASLAADGLRLLGAGTDPLRQPAQQRHDARYAAMAAYFAARSPLGPASMNASAAVQVCLDAGADDADVRRRWSLAHELGPVLVATFAASSVLGGRRTGWRSTRRATWGGLDRGALARPAHPDEDPATTYAAHALAMPVLAVRPEPGAAPDTPWTVDPGVTFAGWVRGEGAARGLRRPTTDDLDHHLSTLFPPVRPQGYLEVRYCDGQPGPWWPVPLAVTAALLEDEAAGEEALAAVRRWAPDLGWEDAARCGLTSAGAARAAGAVVDAALDALARGGRLGTGTGTGDGWLADLVDRYAARWTRHGRSPADEPPGALAHEQLVPLDQTSMPTPVPTSTPTRPRPEEALP